MLEWRRGPSRSWLIASGLLGVSGEHYWAGAVWLLLGTALAKDPVPRQDIPPLPPGSPPGGGGNSSSSSSNSVGRAGTGAAIAGRTDGLLDRWKHRVAGLPESQRPARPPAFSSRPGRFPEPPPGRRGGVQREGKRMPLPASGPATRPVSARKLGTRFRHACRRRTQVALCSLDTLWGRPPVLSLGA